MGTFKCPLWPGCECPDGAVLENCPSLRAVIAMRPEPKNGPLISRRARIALYIIAGAVALLAIAATAAALAREDHRIAAEERV